MAAKTASAAATASAVNNTAFIAVLQRAVNRLFGWPGAPTNFVTITNRQIDQSLDALDDQLDSLIANAVAGSPARWLPDLNSILGLFVKPAIPSYSFTDSLNAMGDFLNRIMPPFKIAPGADTLDGITKITPYNIMGAAVVGAATVLTDMLNGVYDPAQWEIDVIKTTVGATVTRADLTNFTSLAAKITAAQVAAMLGGDGGAFHDPTRVWSLTLPTWTAAQVNPFTIAAYVVTVALYKRFQEVAVGTNFTTSTTYDSWLYTLSLGGDSSRSEYAAGTFHAVDPDGRSVDFAGSLLGTFTSQGGGLVTINTAGGGFTYTNTLPGAAFFHRATSENEADRYDTVNIPVTSADGASYTLTFKIQIIDGSNATPTVSSPTVGTADGLGVVRGNVTGSDSDADTLKYSLVGSSVNGLSGNSAYTKNGAGNGGIVTLNPTTGAFTYVSSATAGATQSFQVLVNDGHGGNVISTVTVANSTSITPANVNTGTMNVVTGSVPIPAGDAGIFTSYALGDAPSKGSVTSFNPATGAFTYTRDSSLGHSTLPGDVVTVLATDANGRTVTMRMNVTPTVSNAAPVIVSSTTDVGNASSARWGLNTSTWTQTTTGKITATDDDQDALSYSLVNGTTHAAVTNTTNGGTVAFNADGSYTYSITKNQAYFHGAAKIGASGSAVTDTFTVAVNDGFGGVAYQDVSIAVYAINSNPSLSVGGLACAFGICTVTITTTDPDGDDLSGGLNTSNNGAGSPWYTLERGSVTINAGNAHTMSWTGNSDGLGTQQTGDQRYTVYDGNYRVNNGIVDTSYFTRAWVDWHDTTRTTGN
jgi:VCBS repeat-containing protein